MGELRWRASLRSMAGLVVAPLIALPSVASLASGNGLSLLGIVFLVGALAIGFSSALLTLHVGNEGIAVKPAGPRLLWENIEGFEVTGVFGGTIKAYQYGVDQPTLLTAQPMLPRRARELVERLDAERTAS